jgi:hypothetical protein
MFGRVCVFTLSFGIRLRGLGWGIGVFYFQGGFGVRKFDICIPGYFE